MIRWARTFPEFDTPLVEGVDVPDGALGEYVVFIERNAGGLGSHPLAAPRTLANNFFRFRPACMGIW